MSTAVSIRTAVPEDLPELQRVYRAASLGNPADRPLLLEHPEFLVFEGAAIADGGTRVAIIDGRVVGFATVIAGVLESDLELDDLFVDPDWQRRGVGRQLVADLATTARSRGVEAVLVTGNSHAKAFYLSMGFVEFSEAPTAFGAAPRFYLDLS